MRGLWTCVLAAAAMLASAVPAQADAARYALVNGCYSLQGDGGDLGEGDAFRMQATRLGVYLLYGRNRDFLADGGSGLARATGPAAETEWRVEGTTGAFTLTNLGTGRRIEGVDFVAAEGCAVYPELDTNTSGDPRPAPLPYGESRGYIDTHLHGQAWEFIGGSIHCGRPWHPYGAPYALRDCPDHEPNGEAALGENLLSHGSPVAQHDTNGWPDFTGWPNFRSLTHEQTYWRWIERAWRGGLRLFTNLYVDNGALCEVYPYKRNPCDEMNTVRLQIKALHEFEDYIDAQYGGPGKGFLRIVDSHEEARRVINSGKLAVVQGIEVSRLFDCRERNDQPLCDRATIDRQFDEMHRIGVRQLELINKFDNALSGVAGDGGTNGVVTNSGNRLETGHYIAMQPCPNEDAEHVHDKPQTVLPGAEDTDPLVGGSLRALLGPDTLPVYGPAPHCNIRGLTELGAYVIRRAIDAGWIFDPDHMSVLGRRQALDLIEAHRYPGVLSSHSWSTPDAEARILALGGLVTPSEKSVASHVKRWRALRAVRSERHVFGHGVSTDQNGFATQPGPKAEGPKLEYPFRSWDGGVTLERQRSGKKTFDLNVDGLAHYGLYPDFVEDVRRTGGPELGADLERGAEAYLQVWERASGIKGPGCRSDRERVTRNGIGALRLGSDPRRLLRRAGQPGTRTRAWTWCVAGKRNRKGEVVAVFTKAGRVGLTLSSAWGHRLGGVRAGDRASSIRGARAFGRGVRVRPTRGGRRFVYVVRKGRVRAVGVAARSVARTPAALRAHLRLADL